MSKLLLTFALALTTLAFAEQSWKPGDKVEAYNIAWYDATILEIGSGNMAGYYKVHYDGHPAASDQFLKASSIRARVAANAKPTTDPSGPRPGKYNCWAYGANPARPLLIDSFEMSRGGSYVSHGKTGKYSFDAASQTVTWESGVNKDNSYKGKFEVENKTHKIRITARALCTNTAP